MKKSEQLKLKASKEENDFKALDLYTKSMREGRLERFEESYLPQLREKYDVVYDESNYKYTVDTDTQNNKYGVVDFFPKANKILIRRVNKWKKPGLQWIVKKLLN